MRALSRCIVVLLAMVFVMAPIAAQAAPVALAFTEAEGEGSEPVAEEPTFEPGMEPAVVTPPEVDADREEPWTARYLAPVLLFGVIVVTIAYFTIYGARVRGRYEVVD